MVLLSSLMGSSMASLSSFRRRMARRVGSSGSPIVLALDLAQGEEEGSEELKARAIRLVEEASDAICAVKINAQLLLPLGLQGVAEILKAAHQLGLQAIMDAKINDVGHTNEFIARAFFEAGFDAVIANPLVGWEEGLRTVFDEASKRAGGVILLVYLSHEAATEGYGLHVKTEDGGIKPLFHVFLERALKWNADGVVVGATHPEKIREAAALLRARIPIYSPGVGAQGGGLETALASGATYPIIGRAIVEAQNPREAALSFREVVTKSRNTPQTW